MDMLVVSYLRNRRLPLVASQPLASHICRSLTLGVLLCIMVTTFEFVRTPYAVLKDVSS
jgi:hypothetical protein